MKNHGMDSGRVPPGLFPFASARRISVGSIWSAKSVDCSHFLVVPVNSHDGSRSTALSDRLVRSGLVVRSSQVLDRNRRSPERSRLLPKSWPTGWEANRRGLGSSFNLLGIGLGGAITPVLITFIMQRWGWRACLLRGAESWESPRSWPGISSPPINPDQNPSRQSRGTGTHCPWLASAPTLCCQERCAVGEKSSRTRPSSRLCSGYFCQGFPIYFFHTWLFILSGEGPAAFSITQGGLYGAIPYLAIALASSARVGSFSDFAVRKFGRRYGQRIAVWVGMFFIGNPAVGKEHMPQTKVTAILLLARRCPDATCSLQSRFWAALHRSRSTIFWIGRWTDEHPWQPGRILLSHSLQPISPPNSDGRLRSPWRHSSR